MKGKFKRASMKAVTEEKMNLSPMCPYVAKGTHSDPVKNGREKGSVKVHRA